MALNDPVSRELRALRRLALSRSLFKPLSLKAAMKRLAFVQADPIRSPARAQDLILRHRVKGYKAGDLEKQYPSLGVEEDHLYAYGFMVPELRGLLHPRGRVRLTTFEKKILESVRASGEAHPAELEAAFGRNRVLNAWGSHSKKTTCALDHLHYRGYLRISRRENGIRVYAPAVIPASGLTEEERLKRQVLVIAGILGPALEAGLRAYAARRGRALGMQDAARIPDSLVREGRLKKTEIDGLTYLWPAAYDASKSVADGVKFLCPFDPVVWDRRRFEHFWGWAYRFEAYTPPKKRMRGYYAMPLLRGEEVIGWVNAQVKNDSLLIDAGFAGKRPADRGFGIEFQDEATRLARFLGVSRSKILPV